MSSPQERASRIPARPLAILLEEIASLRRRERQGEPVVVPLLTLRMEGGHAVTGQFIAFEPSRRNEEQGTVLLLDTAQNHALDLVTVPVSRISALTVHHTPETLTLLSFGSLASVGEGTPPGRLELDRRLASVCQECATRTGRELPHRVDWKAMPDDGDARRAVGVLVGHLEAALAAAGADAMGQEALAAHLGSIVIGVGTHSQAEWQGETLVITGRLVGTDVTFPDAGQIQRSIDRHL